MVKEKAAKLERYIRPVPALVTSYRAARLLDLAWDFPKPDILEYVGQGLDFGLTCDLEVLSSTSGMLEDTAQVPRPDRM